MAFDFSNGISTAGAAVAKSAGDAMLEAQKGELEQEKVKLADQLAGVREEKQRGFLAGESEKERGFKGGESALDRANRERTAQISADASVSSAGISAGAHRYASDQQLAAKRLEVERDPELVRTMKWLTNEATDEQRLLALAQLTEKHDKPPAGYRRTNDGQLEFIPGGPADPAIAKRMSPMNNEQARDAGFADRMQNSQSILSTLDKQGTSAWMRLAEGAGKAGNYAQSEDYQKFRQAKEDFINAQLRRESGAAISADEFRKADQQYFPQPGDKPEVITQKAKNRQLSFDAMVRGAGPTYKPGPNVGTSDKPPEANDIPEGATATNPETGERVIRRNGKWSPL